MVKLATLAALLAGLMLVSFSVGTSVTTVEVDVGEEGDNYSRRFGRGAGGCREQLEEVDELRHCEDFLREQAREGGFGRRRFGGEESYERHGRRGRFGGGEEERRLRNCCQQLRQVDEQCRCEGLREIVRDQQQRQREFGEEREELERVAENLPQVCGVGPGRCDIRRGRSLGRWD